MSSRSGARRLLRLRELRRALRDQGVLRAREGAVAHLPGDDDLAALAERIGHAAAVHDGHGAAVAVAIADGEAQKVALAVDRAGGDLARQLVRAPRRSGGEQ